MSEMPEREPVENAETPHPEDETPEPSSPPCYLNEFPPPAPGVSEKPVEQKPVSELTAEEQMERFEKQLKEDDWGHQPC